ncbi:MAG TPA: O-antigen ligase family protein [Syntrophobacteria bacterium]|nr:O-antigen ligase family protein [Syntrophobacteria bacterium]
MLTGAWSERIRVEKTAELLGAVGLVIFASSCFLSTSGVSIGLGLLVGAMVLQPSLVRELRRDPLILLGAVSTIYLVLRTLWAIWELPETAHLQVSQAWGWFRLWLFVVVAWWLRGDVKRVWWVLLLSLLGLLLGMVFFLSAHPHALWSNERTGFHLKIMPFALYTSTGALGLLVFARRVWGTKDNSMRGALRMGSWVIGLSLTLQGLIVTQSRGMWLTAAVVIPVAAILGQGLRRRRGAHSRRLGAALVGMAVLGFATLFLLNFQTVIGRFSQEKETIAAIRSGDLQNVPTYGVGARIHAFKFGWTKLLERPVIGWGPGSTEYLIARSDLAQVGPSRGTNDGGQQQDLWLDHLFNTYLEVLVRLGLLGALLMIPVPVLLARGLWEAYGEGRLPKDLGLFLIGAMVLAASWCLFEFRLLHPDWRSYWILIGGISATFHFWKRVPACSDAEGPSPPQTKAEHCRGRHE